MTTPSTMRALRQTSFDGPQGLRLVTDAPVPSPGSGEVLVRVTAAGVNYVDVQQTRGLFPGGPQPPYVAGIASSSLPAMVRTTSGYMSRVSWSNASRLVQARAADRSLYCRPRSGWSTPAAMKACMVCP